MDGNLALLVGTIVGGLMRDGIDAEPLTDDEHNYTNQIRITRPSGTYILTVEREEP